MTCNRRHHCFGQIGKKGAPPSIRSGAAMTVHKNRALLFGGVLDHEGPQHAVKCVSLCVRCCASGLFCPPASMHACLELCDFGSGATDYPTNWRQAEK